MLKLSRRQPRALVGASLTLAWALTALPSGLSEAAAQGTEAGIELTLVRQRLWHDEDSRLGLRLRIDNRTSDALDDFVVRVVAYDRVESRTALHESFEATPDILIGAAYQPYVDTRVRPGEARTVTLDLPVSSLNLSDDSGVYPLEVSLDALPAEPLDSFTTGLIYYPTAPEAPLNVVPVLPLSEPPARDSDGVFRPDPDAGRAPLDDALVEGGWLRTLVDELRERRSVRLGVAPTPRLVEEIADMADGYLREGDDGLREVPARAPPAQGARAVLDGLRELLGRAGVQPLLVPYAAPDLPATITASSPADGSPLSDRQFNEAGDVLSESIGVELGTDLDRTWIYPPGGRLDAPTLEALQESQAPPAGALRTFFSGDSIVEPGDPSSAGCPRAFATFTCPVKVRTLEGTATGFVADGGLQQRLGALAQRGDERLHLQRLFAETAMIREELPGLSGRVVHFALPALWRPAPRILRLLLDGLEDAPWLRTRTPARGLVGAERLAPRRVVESVGRLRDDPGSELSESVHDAWAVVESFRSIEPRPADLERLRRAVLVAQSRLWWTEPELVSRGEGYASAAMDEVQGYLANIQLGGRDAITLTSRRARIPLVLFNDNPFRVQVTVHLKSASLDFAGQSEIDRDVTVPEGSNQPFSVQATARSSGEFPLEIELTTPDEELVVGDDTVTRIRIRSTELNRIALAITMGALAFLIAFYVLRFFRQRRAPVHADPPGTTTS